MKANQWPNGNHRAARFLWNGKVQSKKFGNYIKLSLQLSRLSIKFENIRFLWIQQFIFCTGAANLFVHNVPIFRSLKKYHTGNLEMKCQHNLSAPNFNFNWMIAISDWLGTVYFLSTALPIIEIKLRLFYWVVKIQSWMSSKKAATCLRRLLESIW